MMSNYSQPICGTSKGLGKTMRGRIHAGTARTAAPPSVQLAWPAVSPDAAVGHRMAVDPGCSTWPGQSGDGHAPTAPNQVGVLQRHQRVVQANTAIGIATHDRHLAAQHDDDCPCLQYQPDDPLAVSDGPVGPANVADAWPQSSSTAPAGLVAPPRSRSEAPHRRMDSATRSHRMRCDRRTPATAEQWHVQPMSVIG